MKLGGNENEIRAELRRILRWLFRQDWFFDDVALGIFWAIWFVIYYFQTVDWKARVRCNTRFAKQISIHVSLFPFFFPQLLSQRYINLHKCLQRDNFTSAKIIHFTRNKISSTLRRNILRLLRLFIFGTLSSLSSFYVSRGSRGGTRKRKSHCDCNE